MKDLILAKVQELFGYNKDVGLNNIPVEESLLALQVIQAEGSSGGGASQSQIQAAIEAAENLNDLEQGLIDLNGNLGLLSAQYEETPISIAPESASSSQQFDGFANCNCSFTLTGLLANETAVLAIEQKATPNAPYSQMQLGTVIGSGPHTIAFSNFPALELRLRLVSAVNASTRLNGIYWRFGK